MAKKKKVSKASAEAPTSSCLLICDDVLTSMARQKHMIQGIVNVITVTALPAVIGPFAAYIRLSNLYGGQKISINFLHASTDEILFGFDAEAPQESNPLGTHTIVLRIPEFAIDSAGRYIFSAQHGGVPFAESPIIVKVKDERETP